MAYNTGNPVPSAIATDYIDNVEGLDKAMTSLASTWTDRLGVTRTTWEGIVQGNGFPNVGTFAAGFTLTNSRQTLTYDGHEYGWSGVFPKVVAAGSTPTPLGSGGWIDRSDVTLRGELAGSDSDVLIAGSVAKGVANQSKTILDYGATCNGVASDNTAILAMASDVGYVVIPDNKITRITSDMLLPYGLGFFGAKTRGTLKIDSGVRILTDQGPASSTQAVSLSCGVPYIVTGNNLAGKYLEVSNGLPDKIFGAETAPTGSINPIAISRDDSNFGTYKAALFKCVAYDAATQRAYLDVAPDFSAATATASIYDNVNKVRFVNIHFDDANTTTDPERATLMVRRNYDGGMFNCTGRVNYVDWAYLCNKNEIAGNTLTIGATYSFSWNCCDNNVHHNFMVNPKQTTDSVLIFFKNCRRNKANLNTINGWADSGYHWSILFHTNSDYNEAIGNNVSGRCGIGDYAFNKGNLVTDNEIDCYQIVILGAVSCDYNENRIRCRAGAEITVGDEVNFKRNDIKYVGALGGCCVSLYDTAVKPFGFNGFSVTPQRRINFDGTEFRFSESRAAIDYRTKVDFTTGNSATYLPDSPSTILGNGVAAIMGLVQGTRRFSTKRCVYKNIHVGVLASCVTAGSDIFFETGEEKFEDVSAAYIVKTADFNYPARCFEAYDGDYSNVDIVMLSNNWPTYLNGARFGGVGSAMVVASYDALIYTHCIDLSCVASGSGAASGVGKWFDFLTSKPSAPNYAGKLTTTAAHQFSYRVPRGAKYYQPSETAAAARTEMFENQSTPSVLKTIKRTISETAYS